MQNVKITCEATIKSELTPYCVQEYVRGGQTVERKWQTDIFFCAEKNGFFWKTSRTGQHPAIYSYSYNGATYADFGSPGNTLLLSKRAKVPPTVWNSNPLLLPASILSNCPDTNNDIACLWSEVTNPNFWASVSTHFSSSKTYRVSGVDYGNRVTITEADKNSPCGSLGIAGFEISFGATDIPSKKYVCEELGRVIFKDDEQMKTFVFPKRAVFQAFEKTGQLARTDQIEITSVSVNPSDFDETKFTSSEASVAHVYDWDAARWIK